MPVIKGDRAPTYFRRYWFASTKPLHSYNYKQVHHNINIGSAGMKVNANPGNCPHTDSSGYIAVVISSLEWEFYCAHIIYWGRVMQIGVSKQDHHRFRYIVIVDCHMGTLMWYTNQERGTLPRSRLHYSDVIMSGMASLITGASWLCTQPFVQAQINENIKTPRHWPLWGEFTGHRWIPRTKGQ